MNNYTRTELFLDEAIRSLEGRASTSALASGRLEGMMGKLRGIRRAMQKLDKTDPLSRVRFWKLSRRAVVVTVKIARVLSAS